MTTKSVAIVTGASQGIGRATALRPAGRVPQPCGQAQGFCALGRARIDAAHNRPYGNTVRTIRVDMRFPGSPKANDANVHRCAPVVKDR